MRIIIAGSRDFNDYEIFKSYMDALFEDKNIDKSDSIIISGGAKGADSLAEKYAQENSLNNKIFSAKWNIYGKMAGMIRNAEMLKFAIEDNECMLVAFWNGNSRGTLNMIERAKNANIETQICTVD